MLLAGLAALLQGPVVSAAGLTLVEAVRAGDAAAITTALATTKDVNAGSVDGTTALHWAARHGDAGTLKALLQRGAKVDAANRYGVTALRAAAEQGSLSVVETLLKAGADANAVRKESGDTALMIAARAGHAPVVRALIARGAKVETVEPLRKQTALMWAAAEHHPEAVKVLLEAGANTKALSTKKISPLMFAIRAGDIESTRLLLDTGLDVKEPAADGTHMLALAMINAHYELAKFLLERGADANGDDPNGKPMHILSFMHRADNRALSTVLPRQIPQTGVETFALMNELLARGADINARYAGYGAPRRIALGGYRMGLAGATPFFIAATTLNVPLMQFLKAKGADTNVPSLAGITPLLAASGIGFWEGECPGTNAEALASVQYLAGLGHDPKALIGGGSKPDAQWEGSTAMHGAANRGAPDLVDWLAARGVPLDTTSKRGLRPYHHAAGLDGFLFHASPESVQRLMALAKARGETIDLAEPPAPKRPGSLQ